MMSEVFTNLKIVVTQKIEPFLLRGTYPTQGQEKLEKPDQFKP